ncbi:hypothetical protein GCM10020219_039530 [Nonomuraea dietziae]
MMRRAASLGTPRSHSLIGGTHQALLEDRAGVGGHAARHRSADVVVVAEGLHEGHHLAPVEDGHGDAEVGQVADAAFGEVDVVVEEDVAGFIVSGGKSRTTGWTRAE